MNLELAGVDSVAKRSFKVNHIVRLLTVGALLALLFSVRLPAGATGLEEASGGNCSPGGLRYAFSGAGWIQGNSDLRYGTNTPFNAGAWAESWETVQDLDGFGPNMLEAFGDVVVTFEDLSGIVGQASCSGGYVRIDDRYALDPQSTNLANEMRGVFRHELGHTMGLYHVGDTADQAGARETMNTCRSVADRRASIVSSDDWGSWLYHNSDQNDNDVLPNPGFEKDGAAWAQSGVIYVEHQASGGLTGPRRVRLRNDGGGSYRSAMFISDNATSQVDGEMWIRALSSASGQLGFVRITLYFTPRTFAPDACGNYASDRDENDVTGNGTTIFLATASLRAVSSGWLEVQTPSAGTSAGSGVLLVELSTTQRYASGSPASVYVDDVSVRAN